MTDFRPNGLITLTTDFGTQDGYVGAMKGAIVRECADARVLDLTHDVPPQDVFAGAFALAQATRTFPAGTIHVAVVDPGVGTARRAIVALHKGQLFVGPDNGLLALAAPRGSAVTWAIDRVPEGWSLHPTFHGRDLFAPVAGRLAAGTPITDFATAPPTWMTPLAEEPPPSVDDVRIEGRVIHVDRFGNLVTNIGEPELARFAQDVRHANSIAVEGPYTVEIGRHRVQLFDTYADVEHGHALAYMGSAGFLEIGVRDGSARALLGEERGAFVRVTLG